MNWIYFIQSLKLNYDLNLNYEFNSFFSSHSPISHQTIVLLNNFFICVRFNSQLISIQCKRNISSKLTYSTPFFLHLTCVNSQFSRALSYEFQIFLGVLFFDHCGRSPLYICRWSSNAFVQLCTTDRSCIRKVKKVDIETVNKIC